MGGWGDCLRPSKCLISFYVFFLGKGVVCEEPG